MIAALALVVAGVVAVDEGAPATPTATDTFSFAAVPTLTFDTDEGFGTGGVVTLYHHGAASADHGEPYRDAVTLNLFISSKLVQHDGVSWDAIRPFDVAGRMFLRLAYYSTVSESYCGVGNDVTCAPGEPVQRAAQLPASTSSSARDDFVRHYYLMRYQRPYATVIFRPWLRDKPVRTELLVGWRGALTIPGDLSTRGPYPGSLYAHDHADGEPGISSVPFFGVILDDRDHEAFPTRGFYAEASARVAHPLLGSTWSYAGANAQLAGFFTLLDGFPRVVLATRAVLDGIVGEPSTQERARVGGTVDAIAFGGSSIGRGIREQRYQGNLKAIGQAELRAQLFDSALFGQSFNHGAAVFSDVGYIGKRIDDVGARPLKLLATVGVSYRLLWNESFAIRWDLAVSPDENDGPGFYIIVGNAF